MPQGSTTRWIVYYIECEIKTGLWSMIWGAGRTSLKEARKSRKEQEQRMGRKCRIIKETKEVVI